MIVIVQKKKTPAKKKNNNTKEHQPNNDNNEVAKKKKSNKLAIPKRYENARTSFKSSQSIFHIYNSNGRDILWNDSSVGSFLWKVDDIKLVCPTLQVEQKLKLELRDVQLLFKKDTQKIILIAQSLELLKTAKSLSLKNKLCYLLALGNQLAGLRSQNPEFFVNPARRRKEFLIDGQRDSAFFEMDQSNQKLAQMFSYLRNINNKTELVLKNPIVPEDLFSFVEPKILQLNHKQFLEAILLDSPFWKKGENERCDYTTINFGGKFSNSLVDALKAEKHNLYDLALCAKYCRNQIVFIVPVYIYDNGCFNGCMKYLDNLAGAVQGLFSVLVACAGFSVDKAFSNVHIAKVAQKNLNELLTYIEKHNNKYGTGSMDFFNYCFSRERLRTNLKDEEFCNNIDDYIKAGALTGNMIQSQDVSAFNLGRDILGWVDLLNQTSRLSYIDEEQIHKSKELTILT